jgi:predicted Zn-dependent peptidase
MSVVAVGAFSLEQIKDSLELSLFGSNKNGERIKAPGIIREVSSPKENEHVIYGSDIFSGKNNLNVSHYESTCLIPGDVEKMKLVLLRRMLNKRLYLEIRERNNWAYSIKSHFSNQVSFYEFYISCDNFPSGIVSDLKKAVNDCILSLRGNISLFEKEKNGLISSYDLFDFDARQIRDDVSSDLVNHGKIITLHDELDIVKRISIKDIDILLDYLSEKRRYSEILIP